MQKIYSELSFQEQDYEDDDYRDTATAIQQPPNELLSPTITAPTLPTEVDQTPQAKHNIVMKQSLTTEVPDNITQNNLQENRTTIVEALSPEMCNPENESGTVLISDGATSMSTMVPLSPGILMNKDSTQVCIVQFTQIYMHCSIYKGHKISNENDCIT